MNPVSVSVIHGQGVPSLTTLKMESALLQRLHAAFDAIKFWETHETDWVCLDAELMPWSAKAQELIKEQYAPVGVAGQIALKHAADVLTQSGERGLAVQEFTGANHPNGGIASNAIAMFIGGTVGR